MIWIIRTHDWRICSFFLLWFSSSASSSHLTRENLLLKAQWQKHIFVIQMFAFNMFSGCVWDVPCVVRIRDTQQMCFTERKEPLIYHAYLKTINFTRENDSRKMPCNWTISKALAKSARRNELRRSFVRKNRDFITETACLSWL